MGQMILPLIILGVLGLAFGALLGFASKKFAVKQDPTVDAVRACLPGANCGGCGFVGCDDCAKAIASGNAKPNACPVGGAAAAAKIAEALGVEAGDIKEMKAFVACAGCSTKAPKKVEYYGASDCVQASLMPGGTDKLCVYGCLGMGSCVKVCQFGAISVENGAAVVDWSKCTGCGSCAKVCPKHLIKLIPADSYIRVSCSNTEKGKPVMNACAAGCVGCTACARTCPQQAITMENNLPVINYDMCIGCGLCVDKCPRSTLSKM